jgi:hypothetical protein
VLALIGKAFQHKIKQENIKKHTIEGGGMKWERMRKNQAQNTTKRWWCRASN